MFGFDALGLLTLFAIPFAEHTKVHPLTVTPLAAVNVPPPSIHKPILPEKMMTQSSC